MSTALIVCAAPAPQGDVFYERLITSHRGPVIAADGGGVLCHAHGRRPDLLVGDFDSITPEVLADLDVTVSDVRSAPVEKDVSDLDLALEAARQLDVDRAVVVAAWSGRLDHTLSAIGSVLSCRGLTIDLADPGMAGWMLDSEDRHSIEVSGPGATFSLFAFDDDAVVSCHGARYPIDGARLGPLASLGLSNIIVSPTARVHVENGRLLVLTHAIGGTPHAMLSTEHRSRGTV